ncbi:citrate/2-methylcitrate synthase [Georgenia deserti]|uniref:citrate synthase (unknown stereospecificity) n=1 Tax=Georgenia deserti TaxID=2093781 RepID=A0ABW4LA50_9MICO
MSGHFTTAQAAQALGVRQSTVYAYVSRGVLRRTTRVVDGQRISLFDRDEVLGLASQHARPRAGALTTLIESDVTTLAPSGRLAFRGQDVATLAAQPFEEAACIVWDVPADPWPPLADPMSAAVDRGVPGSVTFPPDRIQLAVTLAAPMDPQRTDLSLPHVVAAAQQAIRVGARTAGTSAPDASARPVRQGGAAPDDAAGHAAAATDTAVAPMLWHGLTGRAAGTEELAALETALVVLMDHELAASTLAARVAASTHADPWSCILAGLAALRGPRHGAASRDATAMLRTWLDRGEAPQAPNAGFGHVVYETTDPRAEIVLNRVAAVSPDVAEAVDTLSVQVARRHGRLPNVDLALAALAVACDLPDGAGQAIFMIARTVGFAAHIAEEYPHGPRFRPRAVGS